MFQGPLQESILRRAQDKGSVTIAVHDLRTWTHDRHHVVDDVPYGGGAGMVLKPEPVFEAVEALRRGPDSSVVALTPQGLPFSQRLASELARLPHLILLCGRYEGFDDRIPQGLHALELSIGDFVLSGGEIAALVVLDATVRLIPGVLGDETSAQTDSFATGLLEHPHYTRPTAFRGMGVPSVLLSGDHAAIARWRRKQALRRTRERRPDLLERATLSDGDRELLVEIEAEDAGIGRGARGEKS
ncbi:MAG: tRNA (guanosine(37)-N1)-methyltransferase TrmD [candidate division NC10 bacterium RBG_16_65_8]|nr:MAG: tRNA (guanosine(37)-N1)-methyltransferase TrmD [candidate division NC10 bacterium RBG_16_65_8]